MCSSYLFTLTRMYPIKQGGSQNSSFQFGNSRWQHPGSATVNSVLCVGIAVLFENKVHLKLFKEACKAAPQRIFG